MGASSRVGLSFDELSGEAQDTILRWCFSRPFGPAFELGAEEPEPLEPTEADAGLLRTA